IAQSTHAAPDAANPNNSNELFEPSTVPHPMREKVRGSSYLLPLAIVISTLGILSLFLVSYLNSYEKDSLDVNMGGFDRGSIAAEEEPTSRRIDAVIQSDEKKQQRKSRVDMAESLPASLKLKKFNVSKRKSRVDMEESLPPSLELTGENFKISKRNGLFRVAARNGVTDADLHSVSNVDAIYWDLSDSRIRGPGLRELPLAKVKYLLLSNSPLEDSAFESIARMPLLTNLMLDKCDFITDACVLKLTKLRNLKYFGIGGKCVTGNVCANLSKMKAIVRLELQGIRLAANNISQLSGLPRLQLLIIQDSQLIGEHTFTGLSNCRSLDTLWLKSTPVTAVNLLALKGNSELRKIVVDVGTKGLDSVRRQMPDCKIIEE
ncbi:MAG: hypothetical protein K2Z81_15725, partial [Cyanobacteria bacterium]|nr:hypothetical protein [Cyanobacteriota bacterium]